MAIKNMFNFIPMSKVKSNVFDLSHWCMSSFNMGELIPATWVEMLPGDKFDISTEKFLRFAPLASPIMHEVNTYCHWYFVPTRILWTAFPEWITGESSVAAPYMNGLEDMDPGTLGDYLGYSQYTGAGGLDFNVSPLPIAAYCKIFDEYYRDQNLQSETYFNVVNGQNALYEGVGAGTPFKRAWNHDYFTSCLPFAQQEGAVEVPLTETQTVDVTLKSGTPIPVQSFRKVSDGSLISDGNVRSELTTGIIEDGTSDENAVIDLGTSHEVDVQGSATTINTLRRAFRLQEWLEKTARGGRRYIEHILSHFGVKSSDARLQRPEYICGSKGRMVISEVLSSAQTVDQSSNDVPIGQMAGHGVSMVGSGKKFYRAEEHGYLMCIVSVMPKTAYSQGIHKSLQRFDKLDYAWPSFAQIGEQEVKLSELYIGAEAPATLAETFGYIPRYSEYKTLPDKISGEFKDSLEFWTLARKFSAKPLLNEEFIECDPDHRIFAVTDPTVHKVYMQLKVKIKANRKLPMWGIPTI